MTTPVYLDHHATTPVDPRVVEAMLPYFSERFGNAASRHHSFGWQAEKAVEEARKQIAALIGAEVREIVFTSGATESNNLAVKGAAEAYAARGNHIVTVSTEHNAVLDPDRLRTALTDRTVLVSVMYANNEIGVIQSIPEIAAICRERGVLFHSDAVQAVGKVPVDVNRDRIDLMSLTAHKLYGPKGIGALYVRRRNPRVQIAAQMDGGGHERGMRSGTLNVPGIVGFGAACALAQREMPEESARLRGLRDRLLAEIRAGLDDVRVNGSMAHRLPHNLNLSFAGIDSEALLMGLHEVALSSGSACTSATIQPSHVLKALGLTDDQARGAVRFGLGRGNTAEEIEYVAGRVIEVVRHLRAMAPV